MSNAIPPRPRLATSVKRQFAIVASQFNVQYVQGLIDHITAELRVLAANSRVSLHQVPGAFEKLVTSPVVRSIPITDARPCSS